MEETLANIYWGRQPILQSKILRGRKRKSYKRYSVSAKQCLEEMLLDAHHIFLATQLSIHYNQWFEQQWKVTPVWKEEKRKMSISEYFSARI